MTGPTIKITKAPMRTRCSCQVPATTRVRNKDGWETIPTTIKCPALATVIADGVLMCETHLAKLKEMT